MALLELNDVSKEFPVESGLSALLTRNTSAVDAVNSVNLSIEEGDIVGLVGESGCGKTTLGKLILKIHDITDGDIRLDGKSIYDYGRKDFYRNVQMIFQDPFKSLNTRTTVRQQLTEPLVVHGMKDHNQRISDALNFANLTPPEEYLDRYPHELSGGQKQRVAIARALVLEPSVIVADEPVSMLDVSVRAGVLELLKELSEKRNTTILYISHDLATVRYICNEIAVMYLGKIMERGPTNELTSNPAHPYTERLLSATPTPNPDQNRQKIVYEGEVPDPISLPKGCFFKDRCEFANEECEKEDMSLRPPAKASSQEWLMACHRAEKGELNWESLEDNNII